MGHVRAIHLHSAAEAWSQIAELEEQLRRLQAASESEQRHAAASPTSWVFNWGADGWEAMHSESETHDFGEGITGKWILETPCSYNSMTDKGILETHDNASGHHCTLHHWHKIRFELSEQRSRSDPGFPGVHATFSVLNKHDKTLREVFKVGTATEPFKKLWELQCPTEPDEDSSTLFLATQSNEEYFTPSAEEKAQSVRADGSVRLRAVVHLFP